MSEIKKLLLYSGLGLCILSLVTSFAFVVNGKKSKESVDVLKQVEVVTSPSLVTDLFLELSGIADKNNCGTEGVLGLRLGTAWKEMQRRGKATKEESDTVLEFENALENLSDAMEKIGRTPDLRRRLNF